MANLAETTKTVNANTDSRSDSASKTRVMDDCLIELEQVSKRYGRVEALRDVSLRIPAGITGLLGPNGAGKSTLIKVILGLVSITQGQGRVLGLPLGRRWWRIRSQVGYMPEDDCFVGGLTGVEMVACLARMSGFEPVEALRRTHEILDFAGVAEERYRSVETYSTGMRQKLKFAQAIVHDPPLLILDEPTSGLDPRERQIMLQRIALLAHKHGKSVLISTHILPDVQAICDYVVIMAQGRVRVADRLDVLRRPASPSYLVRVLGDGQSLIARAQQEGFQAERSEDGGIVIRGMESAQSQRVWQWARELSLGVRLLRPAQNSLEQIFVDVVRESQHAHK
jgi:ABC-2 type transport system ATP-binding protein